MTKKSSKSLFSGLGRGLGVGLAGLRAGGALAADSLINRAMGKEPGQSDFALKEAQRFVAELGKMKGSYIKIGQMMALLGEHFLPPSLVLALRDLHDATEPLPYAQLLPQLRLIPNFDEIEVDPNPLAAASLSQVHRARIKSSGEELVLKIQYPGLVDTIDTDFDAVVKMLTVARWLRSGRELDAWMQTLREQLRLEVDYKREAQATVAMREQLEADSSNSNCVVAVPKVYPQYSTAQVLALSFEQGVSVDSPALAKLSLARRNALAEAMLELFFKELYTWGVLQTDPNLGNYLIRPKVRGDSQSLDTLVLLDFGSTIAFDERFLDALGRTIAAGQAQDRTALINALIDLGCLSASSHPEARESFADFCLQLLEPLRPPQALPPEYVDDQGRYCWAESNLMQRVARLAAQSVKHKHFATPTRQFAVIARKLTGVFTFICLLNPRFNGHAIAQRHIDTWLETKHGA
jgi:predicted unusual protein kinase regulating ubiquinone biosynthesis (AarF/ABC1/UbiB family)